MRASPAAGPLEHWRSNLARVYCRFTLVAGYDRRIGLLFQYLPAAVMALTNRIETI